MAVGHYLVGKIIARSRLLEPSEWVAGCRISSDAAGNAQPFGKSAACDKVFYTSMAPLLGKAMPVEVTRQCSVSVFDQRFDF